MGNEPSNCRKYCNGDSISNSNADLSNPGNPIFEPYLDNIQNNANVQYLSDSNRNNVRYGDNHYTNDVFEQVQFKVKKSSDIGNTMEILNNPHSPGATTAR